MTIPLLMILKSQMDDEHQRNMKVIYDLIYNPIYTNRIKYDIISLLICGMEDMLVELKELRRTLNIDN